MSADHERLLPPNDPAAFESLCLDLWQEIWGDSGAQKNGRTGQAQAGVDVFGKSPKGWAGVQCKQKDGLLRTSVTVAELDTEVAAARSFEPKLALFILATSGPRDAKVQQRARELTEAGFEVQVWSWDDIWHELYQRRELLERILPIYWPAQAALRGRRVSSSRLPRVTSQLFGREKELARIEGAWNEPQTHVVTLIAWGGVGKTSLVAKWAADLAARDHDGADYFDWSFYSQGTREKGAASADPFIDAALRFFGDEELADSPRSPWEKGARLAELVARRRTLLVLDGLEPLQHPPGPLAGELQDQGIRSLLRGLAGRNPGLCIVTTRERVVDLVSYEGSTVRQWTLEHLSTPAGVDLLKDVGVHGTQAELEELVRDVKGHALTLNLIGRFLHAAHGGEVRKRDRVCIEEADAEIQGGHAFRVMEAYEQWFATEGERGERLLAVLRLLGLFDRPATADCLEALRRPPAIPDLTEPLSGLSETQWNVAVSRLAGHGFLSAAGGALDAHPLVREHFGRRLREEHPVAWKAAHSRLFDHLKDTTEHWPGTLAGLQPLYQAVFHGCKAGRHEEASAEVYQDRILRGMGDGGFFSTKRLGAMGADLSVLASFFDEPWVRVSQGLPEADHSWLLNEAGFRLRALGRLGEASELMQAGIRIDLEREDWKNAARQAGNLSELELSLGNVTAAVQKAEQAVGLAERSEDAFLVVVMRSVLGNSLHQAGRQQEASDAIRETVQMESRRQPEYPLLYSLRGFVAFDLLLGTPERAAAGRGCVSGLVEVCQHVERRAMLNLAFAQEYLGLLDVALEYLTLGRARLYRALLEESEIESAQEMLEEAVNGLRRAGYLEFLVLGLLTRAWLRTAMGVPEGARADLDEAQEIAERGPMPLHLADVHLYRARLFYDRAALAEARRLVEKHGYGRRREELADLEAMAAEW